MEIEDHSKQGLAEGYGAIFHRIYRILIPVPFEFVRQAMVELQKDPNQFSPAWLARFEKVYGEEGLLKPGDEFQIYITGPWNGPVRVASASADELRLVTLKGHLEAGKIHFRVLTAEEGHEDRESCGVFEIESLARSRDAVVDFVYDKIPIAKVAQTEMWSSFCKSFSERAINLAKQARSAAAGMQAHQLTPATEVGEVQILTERRDEVTGKWEKI